MSTPVVYLNYPINHPNIVRIEDLVRRANILITDSYFDADYMIETEGIAIHRVPDSQRIIFCDPKNMRGMSPIGSVRVDLETGNLLEEWNMQSIPFIEFWEKLSETFEFVSSEL